MNYHITKFPSDTPFIELFNFIKETEKFFCPPISERRDLLKYVVKLKDESVILIAEDSETNNIIGLAAYYCTPSVFRYAFLTYIATKATKKGIGSGLVKQMIRDCKEKGMEGIETQTWESNQKSLALFKKYGFMESEFIRNRENMERSVKLRLVF